MKIKTAKSAGFCFGVKNAVDQAIKVTSKKNTHPVFCLGEIVHNSHVVNLLKRSGLSIITNLDQIKDNNGTIILSAHGVPPRILNKAKQKNLEIVNTTCPMVKKVQNLAVSLNEKNYKVVLIGDKSHPEVKGVVEWGNNNVTVVSNISDAETLPFNQPIGIISQTTFSTELFKQIINFIKQKAQAEVNIHNTICNATEQRQKETEELSKTTDTMFIIGGKNSANTKRLYEIGLKYCKASFWVTNEKEVTQEMLKEAKIIGITAGASTPSVIIKAVTNKIMELSNE